MTWDDDNMTHDPVCPNGDIRVIHAVQAAMARAEYEPTGTPCEFCKVIARARTDERQRVRHAVEVERAISYSSIVSEYDEGYRHGDMDSRKIALLAIDQLAERQVSG